jgi:hypothetical protein
MIVTFLSGLTVGKTYLYRGFADRRQFTVEGGKYKPHKLAMMFQIE